MRYYYANNGVTAYLIRDVRNKNPKNDCPLQWYITCKRKRVYYSTGFSMPPAQWERFEKAEEADFKFKNKMLDLKDYNDSIYKFFNDVLKKNIKKLSDGNNYSFEALNALLGRSDIQSLNDALKKSDFTRSNKLRS